MKRVSFSNTWAEPEALLPRLRDPEIQDCEALDLDKNLLGPEGMRALSKIPFPRLVELGLFANRIGDAGARFLGEAPFARRLKRLGLGGESRYGMDNSIGDEGFLALLPKLEAIEHLQLSYNQAGSAAASALGACASLVTLGLHANRLGDAGARALAKTKLRLEWLNLAENGVTSEGVAALARSSFVDTMKELTLNENNIGDRGATHLAQSDLRPRRLALQSCGLTDAGAAALAASPILTDVETLDLGENKIGVEGLAALVKSPHLKNMKSFGFRNNPAGPRYTPWLDWDGSYCGHELDNAHAGRIAAMFGRPIDVS